jgi:hypothetical protein
VCTNQLTEDRFGKYFLAALKAEEAEEKKLKETKGIKKIKTEPSNLLEMIRKFEFDDVAYGGKAFKSKKKPGDLDENQNSSLIITKDDLMGEVYEKIKTKLLSEGISLANEKIEGLLKKTLTALFSAEDTEISPKFTNVYGRVFTNPKVIKTRFELDLKTRFYFELTDWDVMYAVAETGEWLFRTLEKMELQKIPFENKTISLVYADRSAIIDKLRDLVRKKKLNIAFKEHPLYWWEHNQHFTIFLQRDKKNPGKLWVRRAIYFVRRLRASHISPILLEDNPSDCKILLEIYEAYLQKSKKPGIIVTKEMIEKEMKKYEFDI